METNVSPGAMIQIGRYKVDAMPLPATADGLEEEIATLEAAFSMKLNSALVKQGRLKFDFGDGQGPVGSGFIKPKDQTQ